MREYTWLFNRNGGDSVRNHAAWRLILMTVLDTRKRQYVDLLSYGAKVRDSQERALLVTFRIPVTKCFTETNSREREGFSSL